MSEHTAQFRMLYKELRILDQRQFYEARSAEYAEAHRQAVLVRNTLLLLASLAGVAAQFVTGAGRAGFGVLGGVLAAFAAAVAAFESLIGFEQLRKLYTDAALGLAEAEIDWDAGAAGGDVQAQVDRVEGIFRAENGQWGQLVLQSAAKSARGSSEGGN
jgi:hypothetical protein